MGDEVGAELLPEPGQEREDPVGQPAFPQRLHEQCRDGRRLLGGLQDDGVAGDEGGARHAGRDREREVPGRDHDGDTPPVIGRAG